MKKKNKLVNLTIIVICILFVIFLFIRIRKDGDDLESELGGLRENLSSEYEKNGVNRLRSRKNGM